MSLASHICNVSAFAPAAIDALFRRPTCFPALDEYALSSLFIQADTPAPKSMAPNSYSGNNDSAAKKDERSASMSTIGRLAIPLLVLLSTAAAGAQTADDLIAKNIAAKGGLENIKAITSLRFNGKLETQGIVAEMGTEQMPDFLARRSLSLQGMTQVEAYDGSEGWRIDPFSGRREAERMGEEDTRSLIETSDFYGPLVEYQRKGSTVEYIGHATVDGDDALLLKVTLKNGDILKYYLDPDTFLEIRVERVMFVRGKVRESFTNLGSYKKVQGVFFPFSIEQGDPRDPSSIEKITYATVTANVKLPDVEFKMPAPGAAAPAHPADNGAAGKPKNR